jgi:homoserine kinase type II
MLMLARLSLLASAVTCFSPQTPLVLHPLSPSIVASSTSFLSSKSHKPAMTMTITTTTLFSSSSATIGAIGSTLTDSNLAMEALSKFLDTTDGITMEKTSGGVNNIVQYITLPSGEKQLLRIYNNGLNEKRVQFEHEILRQLNKMPPFSFKVPNFIQSKEGTTTIARLSNGADACMCTLIPGNLPKLTCVEDIGRASGELNTAMANVKVDPTMCNTAPYWKMWDVHHAVTKENFQEGMAGPAFDGDLRDTATRMTREIFEITEKCEGAYQALPTQLIHGDLHYDNVLAEDGKVTGLLDFEFSAFDWRAMELAICLSKYAGEQPDAMPYFDAFIDGFATTGTLTKVEAEAVPDLINLRILSNIVYFVGRAIAGEDDISTITTRIANYERRVNWVKENGSAITGRIVEKMGL